MGEDHDLAAALESARRDGRTTLTEPESYAVASHLGLRIPRYTVVAGPSGIDATDLPAGDRVVVKAISTEIVHKTAVGGVRTVAGDREAVRGAIRRIAEATRGRQVVGYLIAEHIEYSGPELMLGFRRTDGFGPVLTVGAGGVRADALAQILGAAVLPVPCDAMTVIGVLREGPPLGDTGHLMGPLAAVVDRAAHMPEDVVELDLNPVVMTPGGLTALDAFCRRGEAMPVAPERDPELLEAMLLPETIGVIGVSSGENPGRVILRNILAAGFPADRVVVVKPGVAEIDGVRCVPTLAALAEKIDLLVVSVAASVAAEVVEEVADGDLAGAVVLIPGGMGERSGSERLADRVRSAILHSRSEGRGPVVVGGNCMGIRSVPGRYDTTFIPPERLAAPPEAPVAPLAVISQSGAFAIARLDRFAWMRPRFLVTVGNQVDVTIGDVLDRVSHDPEVAVAACYVEGFQPGDGARFLSATRRLTERGGAVVVAFGGTTGPGRSSAASHTAAIATDTRVAASLVEQAGALVAESLDEFEDLVRIAVLLHDRVVGGRRLGAVSNAGFEAVAMADALGALTFAEMSPATRATIGGLLTRVGVDEVVAVKNPLDLTPIADDAAYGEVVRAVLDDPGVDVAAIGCVPLTPALRSRPDDLGEGSIGRVLAALGTHRTPWIAVVDGGAQYAALRTVLEEAGVPVFTTADRAVRVLARYVSHRTGR